MSKNPHAVALGRKAKGVPKQFSKAELKRRTDMLLEKAAAARARKKAAAQANKP
jgi:hypothetical protein